MEHQIALHSGREYLLGVCRTFQKCSKPFSYSIHMLDAALKQYTRVWQFAILNIAIDVIIVQSEFSAHKIYYSEWQIFVFSVDPCLTVVVCSISVLRSGGIGCWAALCFSSASPCCTYCLLLHQDKKLLLPEVENTEREEQSQQVLLQQHTHTLMQCFYKVFRPYHCFVKNCISIYISTTTIV